MSNVVFECMGVELREAGGETFSTLIPKGRLVIKSATFGGSPTIQVDNTVVDFVNTSHTPLKKVDQRTFMLATGDLMTFNYITLPAGLNTDVYERFEEVLTCIREGKAIPAAKPSVPKAAAADAAPAAAASTPAGEAPLAVPSKPAQQGGGLGDFLKTIADKAAHDTQMLASAIQQKAAHDIAQMDAQKKAAKPA